MMFPEFPHQEGEISFKTKVRFFPLSTPPPNGLMVWLYLFDEDGHFAVKRAIFDKIWIYDYSYNLDMKPACWTFIARPPNKFNIIKMKNNKGGKREGAGRPLKQNKRERLQITLPPDLLKQVREKGNPSNVIEAALVSFFSGGA